MKDGIIVFALGVITGAAIFGVATVYVTEQLYAQNRHLVELSGDYATLAQQNLEIANNAIKENVELQRCIDSGLKDCSNVVN